MRKETIDIVLENYGPLGGDQLSRMTHNEASCREARAGLAVGERSQESISLERMQDYYTAFWQSDVPTSVNEITATDGSID
ncbi:MAG: hypothetical protein OXI96_01800 [Acidimicrobiaceae bacterium]|nr:hypothetical protein [Acidimicrobiaceae bacterium]